MRSAGNKKFRYSQLKLFFFISAPLKEAQKSICSLIDIVLLIIDLKIILEELLSLPNLVRAQTFYIHELTKVLIFD